MSAEEKDKLNEHRRNMYCRLTEELKNKRREYARDRYYIIKAC